jgi:hypothetical protein
VFGSRVVGAVDRLFPSNPDSHSQPDAPCRYGGANQTGVAASPESQTLDLHPSGSFGMEISVLSWIRYRRSDIGGRFLWSHLAATGCGATARSACCVGDHRGSCFTRIWLGSDRISSVWPLRTRNTIGTFRSRLGEPDVEQHHGQTISFVFNLPDARITTLTDEHRTVAQCGVASTSLGYKPRIELTPASVSPHLVVVLGKSTFLSVEESLQRQSTRLSSDLGASHASYEEIYWFGRPGEFNYFVLSCDHESPFPWSHELLGGPVQARMAERRGLLH